MRMIVEIDLDNLNQGDLIWIDSVKTDFGHNSPRMLCYVIHWVLGQNSWRHVGHNSKAPYLNSKGSFSKGHKAGFSVFKPGKNRLKTDKSRFFGRISEILVMGLRSFSHFFSPFSSPFLIFLPLSVFYPPPILSYFLGVLLLLPRSGVPSPYPPFLSGYGWSQKCLVTFSSDFQSFTTFIVNFFTKISLQNPNCQWRHKTPYTFIFRHIDSDYWKVLVAYWC